MSKKKKRLDRKRSSKKRILLHRNSESRFEDKFSDITRTDNDSPVLSPDDMVPLADGTDAAAAVGEMDTLVADQQQDLPPTEPPDDRPSPHPSPDNQDDQIDEEMSLEVPRTVLDTVAESVTENIMEKLGERDEGPSPAGPGTPTGPRVVVKGSQLRSSSSCQQVLKRRKTRQRVSSAPSERRPRSGRKQGETVSIVTARLTESKSLITRRMERAESRLKRVKSAPVEVQKAPTPPQTGSRQRQPIPISFTELERVEQRSDSKWVLQCLEPTELLRKPPNTHRKRIASAPPKFTQDPSTLRPAYMNQLPVPAIEPVPYNDETYHEKIIERRENRQKVAAERHANAAARRHAILSAQRVAQASRRATGPINSPVYPESPPPAPLPTAASSSTLNFRLKSASSFGRADRGATSTKEQSKVLAKAASLRHTSEQMLSLVR
eukprot:sb/3464821/